MSDALRMVRLEVDPRRLLSYGGGGLPPGHDDLAFVAHRLLSSLFGERTVQPFRLLADEHRKLTVLGYTTTTTEALRTHAQEFGDPLAHASVAWDVFATKEMPTQWEAGRRLGFEIRLCPVVRLASARTVDWKGEPRSLPAGVEIDAFVHTRHLKGDTQATREGVYHTWLQQRLGEAAGLLEVSLRSFRRLRLVRRTHEPTRTSHLLERPDTLLTGTLSVGDPGAFQRLLAHGVGRHRTYGFGMVLLHASS